jgi:hypothetical protein
VWTKNCCAEDWLEQHILRFDGALGWSLMLVKAAWQASSQLRLGTYEQEAPDKMEL